MASICFSSLVPQARRWMTAAIVPVVSGALVLSACSALFTVGTAGAAAPTVVGKVTGHLPPKSRALTEIRVFDLARAGLVAKATPKRGGTFRLKLAPGAYLLVTTVTPEEGRAGASVRRLIPLTLARGQRRSGIRISKPKRGGATAAGSPSARAAYTQESGAINPGDIAFSIEYFTGATGDLGVMNRGLSALLQTDLTATPCRSTEVVNSSDRALVERELDLGRSRYFDPSTVPRRNFILPDIVVKGRLHNRGNDLGYTIALVDARTGRRLEALSGTMQGERIFEAEQALAARLARRICTYGEVFEVTFTGTGRANFATHSATGTLSAQPITAPPTERDARGPTRWQASAPIGWTDVAVTSTTSCSYADPVSGGSWTVKLSRAGSGMEVEWGADKGALATVTVICPNEAPPIPGQPATSLVGSGPVKFVLPQDARQRITGGLTEGGGGWDNTLELKVRTIRVQRL
jgi:hypothetical protein